jgi:two-component system sensor histidine kinase BaeS
VIKAHTSLASRRARSNEEYRKSLETIDKAADAMAVVVQDLLTLANGDAGLLGRDRVDVSLIYLLNSARDLTQHTGRDLINLDGIDDYIRVNGNPNELIRVFRNLFDNAVRHTPLSGAIIVTAELSGCKAIVRVADTGEGIASDHLSRVCERFYRADSGRTREQGGAGLGLAICKSIVELHDGKLEIESVAGQGTTVSITLTAPGAVR